MARCPRDRRRHARYRTAGADRAADHRTHADRPLARLPATDAPAVAWCARHAGLLPPPRARTAAGLVRPQSALGTAVSAAVCGSRAGRRYRPADRMARPAVACAARRDTVVA